MIEYTEYIDALQREGRALGAAARAAGVDANVPSCPDWRVADLLGHVGRLHRWVAAIVASDGDAPVEHWSNVEPPPDAVRLDWFDGGVDLVADALRAAGPNTPAWSWTDDHTAGFWARRQANETAVHRWDGQGATGAVESIEAGLARDGIDEFLALLPFWRGVGELHGAGETIHLHCTDGEGEWLLRLGEGEVTVTREHAKGDVAARGTASDLVLFLYGRVAPSSLEVFGDAPLLDRWQAQVRW